MAHHVIGVFGREMQISLTVIAKHPHREQFGDKLALDVHLPRAENRKGKNSKAETITYLFMSRKVELNFMQEGWRTDAAAVNLPVSDCA